jgi:hypothetical protein
LSFRLDGDAQLEFMSIFTPLHVCLFTLMLTSCGGKGGNRWWCGMRSDFCTALLRTCSCLTLYGNIYVGEKDDSSSDSGKLKTRPLVLKFIKLHRQKMTREKSFSSAMRVDLTSTIQ